MGQNITFYHNLYLVCGFLGLAGLVATVLIYYYFDMGKIIRDMLGITKKMAIREMEDSHNRFLHNQRKQLEALANDLKIRKNAANSGEQTGETGDSGRSATKRVEPPRMKFKIQKAEERDIKKNQEHLERKEALAEDANAAVPFDGDAPTDLLEHVGLQDGDAATALLPRTEQERAQAMAGDVQGEDNVQDSEPRGITAVLYKEESQEEEYIPRGDTMVLNPVMIGEEEKAEPVEEKKRKILFILEKQILLTHTDEVIDA